MSMRVMVTGASGSIGTVVCRGLVDREYAVLGLDRTPEPEGFSGDWYTADCADPDEVEEVFANAGRIDGVVHLAGSPDEGSLPEELTSHVVTTAALLDAMALRESAQRLPDDSDAQPELGGDVGPQPSPKARVDAVSRRLRTTARSSRSSAPGRAS